MRRGTGFVALASALMMVGAGIAAAATAAGTAQPLQQATGFGSDWPVYHHDALGGGVDSSGTSFSPATAAWTSTALDGPIFGEPLVEAGRVVVATENNTVYVLAANNGTILWSTHIAAPVPSGNLPCGDISPTVGITSTPVIDPTLGEVFVVADESVAGNGAAHHLVGLDLYSGRVRLDTVVDPPGSHPLYQLQRPGLALDAGQVLVGFGGNAGDCETSTNPYHGWLVAAPESGWSLRTFEVAANTGDSQGAIWMGGASPIVDGSGNIWLGTGNSAFTSSTDAYDNSDGVIELNSALVEQQFFAPSAWYADNGADADLGSSSPVLMGNGLVLQSGKTQTAFVLSRSSLGGIGGQLTSAGSYCGSDVDGGSAVIGNIAYTPCLNGVVKTQVTPGTPPTVASVWQTSTGSGGPPIVAGGLVWTIDHNTGNLYSLDPTTGGASQTFSLGSVPNHFPTPAAADGLVLAVSSDQVHAFDGPAGLPPPPPAALPYVPVTPTRICDTRAVQSGVAANPCNGNGTGTDTLGPGQALTITVPGLPTGATAAVLNVTVTNTTAASYLTAWPTGTSQPNASNLNWVAGQTVPNLVEVTLGSSDRVSFYNAYGSTDVVVDLEGYVAPASVGAGLYNPLAPARICDTRGVQSGVVANQCNHSGGSPGTLGPGGALQLQVTGQGGVPSSGVAAVVLNVTVTDTSAPSYLTVWPQGTTQPNASDLNWVAGSTVPNRVIVPVGSSGQVTMYNAYGSTDVVVDVGGWFTDNSNAAATGAGYVALSPSRICDTRAVQSGVVANQCNFGGTGTGTLGPGGSRSFLVAGVDAVPSAATAVVANVTVTDTSAASYLTVWPDGTSQPNASDLNWVGGQTVPNLAVAELGSDGSVDVYNADGSTGVVVDVEGYYLSE